MKSIIITYIILPLVIAILAVVLLYGWFDGGLHWGDKYIILPKIQMRN